MLSENLSLTGINNRNNHGRKVDLLKAAEKGNLEKVKFFISYGCCVDQTNTTGKTALILAATNGHIEVVSFLCQKGADTSHKDCGNWTAIKYAQYYSHRQVVDILERFTFLRRKRLTA